MPNIFLQVAELLQLTIKFKQNCTNNEFKRRFVIWPGEHEATYSMIYNKYTQSQKQMQPRPTAT